MVAFRTFCKSDSHLGHVPHKHLITVVSVSCLHRLRVWGGIETS